MRLRLSAVWVTMVAFDAPVAVPDGLEGEAVFRRHYCCVTTRWLTKTVSPKSAIVLLRSGGAAS